MDAERPAMHVQRPRLGPTGLDCAGGESVVALAHNHSRSGLAIFQRLINWAEVHPSDLRVNPEVTN